MATGYKGRSKLVRMEFEQERNVVSPGGCQLPVIRGNGGYIAALKNNSNAIKVARVLCIFFMTYVHVYLFASPYKNEPTYIILSTLLKEVLGRSSVPLLSVVSGFLMVGYFQRKHSVEVYKGRFAVLIIPLLFWSLAGSALLFAFDSMPLTINTVLPLTGNASQVHLSFLRDLFVICLITPALLIAIRRAGFVALAVIVLVSFTLNMSPVILRSQILAYYAIGLFVGLYAVSIPKAVQFVAVLILILSSIALIANNTGMTEIDIKIIPEFDNLVLRPACAISFWVFSLLISQSSAMNFLGKYLEPAVYLFFLSHLFFVRIFAGLYGKVDVLHCEAIYDACWLLIPFACLGVAVVGKTILTKCHPIISITLSGK